MNSKTILAALLLSVSGAAAWAAPEAKPAEAPASEQTEMTADEVLDKANEAMWGKTGQTRDVKTLAMEATFSMPAQGMTATVATWFDMDAGAMRTEVDIPNFGKETSGVVNGKAWSNSTITGPRVLTGDEARQAMQQADFYADLDYKESYFSREHLGTEQINGKTAHKIKVVREEGDDPEFRWYDADSWLLVKQSMTSASPMGEIDVVTTFDDYREIEGAPGVRMPYKTTMTMVGMQQLITINAVRVNPDLPEDQFTPPEAVQKLMG